MKQWYQNYPFKKKTLAMIDVLNSIVEDYSSAGFTLTVRQLYYQLVARGIVPNTEASYKTTCTIVNQAKNAGMISWDAIEDRTRSFKRQHRWRNGFDAIKHATSQFHMDKWERQPARLYAVIEKEALAGVFSPVCLEYDIPLLSARGYPSGTVLREFAQEYVLPYSGEQETVILHFGDHDPSGIDMSRDLEERINLYSEGASVSFTRVALNMSQINEIKPPPNPAKVTDSRFKDYQKLYGQSSWELDALDPRYLQELARENILPYIDGERWAEREEEIRGIQNRMQFVNRMYFKGR